MMGKIPKFPKQIQEREKMHASMLFYNPKKGILIQ